MLINLVGQVLFILSLSSSLYGVPVEGVKIETEHLILVVLVASRHHTTNKVHVLAGDDSLMVSDSTWDLSFHC